MGGARANPSRQLGNDRRPARGELSETSRRSPSSAPQALLSLFGLLVLLIPGLACAPEEAPDVPGRVPLVLIVLDALHAGHISHLGYELETTPNLDQLAREGVSFERALAPAPYTLASIPSIFTGRRPDSHGLVHNLGILPADEETLAELLSSAGYRTRAAVANPKGSSHYDLDQGFDEFVELFREGGDSEKMKPVPVSVGEFHPLLERWCAQDRGIEQPVFYYLHILEPHLPYQPPREWLQRYLDPNYTGIYRDGVHFELMQSRVHVPGEEDKGDKGRISKADRDAVRASYDANLAWADHNVGLIFERLKAEGLYDEAMIVVTSDHGESFWQHGRWGHSQQVYDDMLRVPMVVKFPCAKGPVDQRVQATVSTLDLLPSLCEWLDLQAPQKPLDGRSLVQAAIDPRRADAERSFFLRSFHPEPSLGLSSGSAKTILNRDRLSGAERSVEHYDLGVDPKEKQDLAGQAPGQMERDLERLRDFALNLASTDTQQRESASADERDLLEKLGYVDDEGAQDE